MTLILSHHPTYAFFHNPYEWGAFEIDLDRFARLLRGELRPGPKRLIANPTDADIKRIVKNGGKRVACDIESRPSHPSAPWTGKSSLYCRLRTLAISNSEEGASVMWHGEKGTKARDEMIHVLGDKSITKVFQNGYWFDIPVLERHEVRVRGPILDTRDGRRALSSTSPLRLDYMAAIYDDPEPWKEYDADDEKGGTWKTTDLVKLRKYNAQDAVETERVMQGIEREDDWNTPRVQRLYEIHKELSQIAYEMHETGIRVDVKERQKLADDLLEQYNENEKKFLKEVGIPGFRCTPNDIRALIYERHQTDIVKRFSLPDPIDADMWADAKERRTVSVDKSSLLLLLVDPDCPDELKKLIDLYWAAEETWKSRSTFVVSEYIDQAIGPDGRLHPNWNSCGTETMRWSCAKPNLMNVEQELRRMYCASKGNVWCHADKSSMELRVLAAISKDPKLQDALDSGDVYSYDAREWFKLPAHLKKCDCEADECKKPDLHVKPAVRKGCKIIHLASNYAAGTAKVYAQALSDDRKMTYQMVSLFHGQFKKTYRALTAKPDGYWWKEQERVRACGYSEGKLLFGRRTYPSDPPITEVANFPIQRTAGEMINLETIELHRALKKYVPSAKLIEQLHDALGVDTPARHEGVVRRIMEEVMDKEYEIEGDKYHFPVEIKSHTHWHKL